jgi:hypothetical protein
MAPRRFLPPWTGEELGESYVTRDGWLSPDACHKTTFDGVSKILPLLACITLAACTVTPRTAPPIAVGHANGSLEQASNCIFTALNKTMSGHSPAITNFVKVIQSGKVEEITGTAAGLGELYVVSLVAENDGIKAVVHSVLKWSSNSDPSQKYDPSELEASLSSCVSNIQMLHQ